MTQDNQDKSYQEWDGYGCHPYKKGSRHNKIGMWIMWIFYIIVIIQLIYAFLTIPFFPITFITLIILSLMSYVVIVAKSNHS